ncbi:MAG: AraC family transcriptional regulator [Candidatus Omnitrophota bacterium]
MKQAIAIRGLSQVEILRNFEKNFRKLTDLKIIYLDLKQNNPLNPQDLSLPLFNAGKKQEKILKFIDKIGEEIKSGQKPKVFSDFSLITAAIPIIAKGEIIAIALTSFARSDSSSSVPTALYSEKRDSKIDKLWQQLPVINKEDLQSWANILFDTLNYIFKHEYDFLVFSEMERCATRAEETLQRALVYINENYHHRDISLGMVAKEVFLSHFYFSHLFKRELKMTFIDYLTQVRLESAKKLLKNLKLNVNQVAYAVGYQDPNYFSKVFKRNLKMTPHEYRTRIVKNKITEKDKKIQ